MRKRILVTAGGTATAWHIANVARTYFSNSAEIHVCDINPPHLVPASTIVQKVHQVPLVTDGGYKNAVSDIIKKEGIDWIVPLIPEEAFLLAKDGDFINQHNIKSTAPLLETARILTDKKLLNDTLNSLSIPAPSVYEFKEVKKDKKYILKPRLGFGSQGIEVVRGEEINPDENRVIQEYCEGEEYDEVTVEIYNGKIGVRAFARRRVATKAGVCIKMEPLDNSAFLPAVKKLVEHVECPIAFNVQFLRNNKVWKLFDCNLRLGAGTALSSAIGFQLTRALLAEVIGQKAHEEWFSIDPSVKSVLRVYQEVLVR